MAKWDYLVESQQYYAIYLDQDGELSVDGPYPSRRAVAQPPAALGEPFVIKQGPRITHPEHYTVFGWQGHVPTPFARMARIAFDWAYRAHGDIEPVVTFYTPHDPDNPSRMSAIVLTRDDGPIPPPPRWRPDSLRGR